MNEVQALNVLTNLANESVKKGVFQDINESGAVYVALSVLANALAPTTAAAPEAPAESEEKGEEE